MKGFGSISILWLVSLEFAGVIIFNSVKTCTYAWRCIHVLKHHVKIWNRKNREIDLDGERVKFFPRTMCILTEAADTAKVACCLREQVLLMYNNAWFLIQRERNCPLYQLFRVIIHFKYWRL